MTGSEKPTLDFPEFSFSPERSVGDSIGAPHKTRILNPKPIFSPVSEMLTYSNPNGRRRPQYTNKTHVEIVRIKIILLKKEPLVLH